MNTKAANMRLLYLANVRLPTEKAHGLQIMQNCEAFAGEGVLVSLWAARRFNTAAMQHDPFIYYGVKPVFSLRRVPCIDLLPLVAARSDIWAKLAFYIQQTSYILALLFWALFARADVYYSRDAWTLLALSFIKPRAKLVYEAHTLAVSAAGQRIQRWTLRRVGTVIALTSKLRDDLLKWEPDADKFGVAHDGIQQARFANMPAQEAARAALGWQQQDFIVGYMGRLHTMSMDKGVGTLIDALAQVEGAALALVGGPDDMAQVLRERWLALGLDERQFLYVGQVRPEQVPLYLSAFDVCTIPFPWTAHFAYYASPIKLFEYMAAGRAIVASDLPALADVVRHGQSALLVPPGDVAALAGALITLRDGPALRQQLAQNAYQLVMARYTWQARAQGILEKIRRV